MTSLFTLIQIGLLSTVVAAAPESTTSGGQASDAMREVTFNATTLDGVTHQGSLTHCDMSGITVQTADGAEEITLGQLARIVAVDGSQTADNPQNGADHSNVATSTGSLEPSCFEQGRFLLTLIDDTRLFVAKAESDGEKWRATLADGRSVTLPRDQVAAVQMLPGSDSIDADWQVALSKAGSGDLIVIRKDDQVDYLDGVIHKVTDDTVQFELDGEILPVPRERLHGLIMHRSGTSQVKEPIASLLDRDGNLWKVQSFEMGKDASGEPSENAGSTIWLTTGTGLVQPIAFTQIMRFDFSQGKIVYLSDLQPESFRWTPLFPVTGFDASGDHSPLELFFSYRTDRSSLGGPIRLDGRALRRGLALHSHSEITYRLPDRFSRLKAVAGIDDRVRPRGDVQLTILGDERVLWDESVSGSAASVPIDIDLTNVRRLTIRVDFGKQGDVADHLDLGDIRLVK